MRLEESLLEILACPRCHGKVGRQDDPEGFTCGACGLFYAVEEGVPNFRIDEAIPWGGAGRDRGRR